MYLAYRFYQIQKKIELAMKSIFDEVIEINKEGRLIILFVIEGCRKL
jgi:hypothetical protein